MTITRLWQSGFETGSADEVHASSSGVPSTTEKKTGSYSWRLTISYNHRIQIDVPTTRQIQMNGWKYYFWYGNDVDYFMVRAGTIELVQLINDTATGKWFLKTGGVQRDITDVGVERASVWQNVGLDCKIHSTAGWAKIYLEGKEILSYEGNTGNSDITNVIFGSIYDAGTSIHYAYWDDCYVNDSDGESIAKAPPPKRFYYLTPNADGNYTNWLPSSGSAANHYADVDEKPPSDSDYLSEDTVGEKDSLDVTTFTVGSDDAISALIPIVRAKKGGANEKIKLGTRSSGSDAVGSDIDLTTAYAYYTERQETKPGGGSWDQSSMDDVEVLIESSGSF